MTETNAITTNVNTETGEIKGTEIMIDDNHAYTIFQNTVTGEYRKEQKYAKDWSKVPETEEEVIHMYNILNSDEEDGLVVPMKNTLKQKIDIEQVYFNPYEKFDTKTGNMIYGVVTMIQSPDGTYYATSSKSVYFDLKNIFETFGKPNTPNYRTITVLVKGTKVNKNIQIGVKFDSFKKEQA